MNNTINRILNLVTEAGIPGFGDPIGDLENATNIRPKKKKAPKKKKKAKGFLERSAALKANIERNSPPETPGR